MSNYFLSERPIYITDLVIKVSEWGLHKIHLVPYSQNEITKVGFIQNCEEDGY